MTLPIQIHVERANAEDLPDILGVQHRAFSRVARDYELPPEEFPPVRESLHDVRELAERGTAFWKAVTDEGRIVGSVRAEPHPDGTVEIGRLVIDDGFEGLGVGTALMAALEASFPSGTRFDLFTGKEARRPLGLYQKLGYRVYREETVGAGIELVWMEKHS